MIAHLDFSKFPHAIVFISFFLLFAVPVYAQSLYVSSHYDLAREAPIFGANYNYAFSEDIYLVGFAEMWYNPEHYAFPEDSWPVFSKHWVSYALTSRLSLSVELEISRNLPGAWSRSPVIGTYTFEPDRWHLQPKVGASFQVF